MNKGRCLVVCMNEEEIYIYVLFVHLYIRIHCETHFLSAHQDDGGQNRHGEERVWSKGTLDIVGKVELQSAVDRFRLVYSFFERYIFKSDLFYT